MPDLIGVNIKASNYLNKHFILISNKALNPCCSIVKKNIFILCLFIAYILDQKKALQNMHDKTAE